jgi:2-polyprenyl-3-methyl-5-hydroxy-6-metoxy-1,4-benzoquinol methylase
MSNLTNDWETEYQTCGAIWGTQPSELAKIAVDFLQKNVKNVAQLRILDIGCGYGRDALYFSSQLNCHIQAIDVSPEAIELANAAVQCFNAADRLEFHCQNFTELNRRKQYDVVFISNLYHLLRKDERVTLRERIARAVQSGGYVFLSTLSINDREEYGKGCPVPGETNSFQGEKYFHFCSREELLKAFGFLTVHSLYEHRYVEYRTDRNHHHISWILLAQID